MSLRPSRSDLGRLGEAATAARYRAAGYRVLARNWRCALGEIDLVLTRDGVLVFCEVKARRALGWGGPFEAVTWKKQRKLRMLAEAYLVGSGPTAMAIRFDVASVTIGAADRPSVFVYENAF